ncbi:PREDICTED: uncharacterized protein LOC107192607 [Dufourea novaeangliae]|uniref:uncharacterized protein LOC107192607 n=1 Tax=Dufourea novaeangliae TaxID=178035 RepID=UPI000767766C|nr:PREDICTED: uncharacterized protein LOC107192607 [Dufourea novaeangliae]
MKRVQTNNDPQMDNTVRDSTNFIELNVDMNVTVSNVKKSKMFQRSRGIFLFLLAIAFAVILSHLRKEVRALQVQMQSVNVNLLVLMSKYDRLNRSLNRAWINRPDRFLEHRSMHNVKRLLEDASSMTKTMHLLDNIRNGTGENLYAYNVSIIPYLNTLARDEQASRDGGVHGANETNEIINLNPLPKPENDRTSDEKDESNSRIERAILTAGQQNSSAKRIDSDRGETVGRNNDTDDEYTDDYVDDESQLDIRREPRSGRSRRDEGRGKKRGKNKRRPKRSRRRLGPLVATFVGAIPEQHVTDTVYIGPWVRSTKNNTQYSLNKFHLVEDKKSIEVTATGLYMISAQIFYFGEPTNYSYWILLSSEGKSTSQKLVKCSTASSTSATEVSCYTSVITPLQRGDRVHIQQQEKNRLINMREGHSYIQLVLLSNNIRKKRQR